jgi:hypothetical protein
METSYDGIERLSPSIACAAKTVFATFEILKKADGNLPSKLSDEEKNLLPLQPIYFLGPNE